jgi:nucleotide-binding universal stress UspA family protein
MTPTTTPFILSDVFCSAENDIQFKSQIEESMSVAGTIVDYAENQNIDLIVVGSRGRSDHCHGSLQN